MILFFGDNSGSFITQISLSESNIDLGNNPIVDSVVMTYSIPAIMVIYLHLFKLL